MREIRYLMLVEAQGESFRVVVHHPFVLFVPCVQSTCKNVTNELRPSCEMQGLLFEGKGEKKGTCLDCTYMLFGSKISLEI